MECIKLQCKTVMITKRIYNITSCINYKTPLPLNIRNYHSIFKTFLSLISNELLRIHKMLARIANRDDPDQPASLEAL